MSKLLPVDWQGIAHDRGRIIQHAATQHIKLKYPEIPDSHERAVLVKNCFDQWAQETETAFSKLRTMLYNNGDGDEQSERRRGRPERAESALTICKRIKEAAQCQEHGVPNEVQAAEPPRES
jgi:hypothetical protein